MSTAVNVGKDRCKGPKSLPTVEGWAILRLRLRVRVGGRGRDRSKPPGSDPTGNPEVQICGPLSRDLGQDAGRGDPLGVRVPPTAEDQIGSVLEVDDHAPIVDLELG